MGLIMVMILEKLEEIPPELLSLLSGTVTKDNQNVLPIARELGGMPCMRPAEQCMKGALAEKSNGIELQDSVSSAERDEKNLEEDKHEEAVVEERKEARELEPVVEKDREESSKEQGFEEEAGPQERKANRDKNMYWKRREQFSKGRLQLETGIETKAVKSRFLKRREGLSSEEVAKQKVKKRAKKDENGQKKPVCRGRQVIKTRCSQHQMHEFLSNLEGNKRSIIQSSIFSAFLDIPKRSIRPSMAHALIERYDAEMDAFILAGQPK
ncbi:unnamed protein product [Dovyalis caffra]|uniref:Uncharacterized protein n=1 Tax=Dovyalis caffra TaxID=77055 RepID=A0AAV1RQU4_9ROSI|nr:unnamed protein product [Dovyalis caffra]